MKKNIEIETYSINEVLGTICKVIDNNKLADFAEDLKKYHELSDNFEEIEIIEFITEIANKYTSGFWYCYECDCFYSNEDYSKGNCPQCWLENA